LNLGKSTIDFCHAVMAITLIECVVGMSHYLRKFSFVPHYVKSIFT